VSQGEEPEDQHGWTDPEETLGGFRATARGVTARFARPQATILRDLVQQVVELVVADEHDAAAGQVPSGAAGDPEADELAALVGMTEPADPSAAEQPDDPVLARLLPDGYRDDPEAAREFRAFTESGLRSAKVAAASTLLSTLPPGGGRVKLTGDQAEAWLRSLNDVRLALGVRLGVTDDFDGLNDELTPDDPRAAYVWIYQWLAYLQESLVLALS
jgi:hypothetical protein